MISRAKYGVCCTMYRNRFCPTAAMRLSVTGEDHFARRQGADVGLMAQQIENRHDPPLSPILSPIPAVQVSTGRAPG